MARKVPKCRLSTRMMIVLIALIGLGLGLYELSRRNLWGPWPRWVKAIHSNEDYYKITLPSAMRAVEGKDPDVSAEMAIPALIAALDDPKDLPRIAAITALGRTGPGAAKAVPKLIMLLKTPPPWIQGHAAHALGDIVTQDCPEKDDAISALLATANDAYPKTPASAQVRAYVIQSLNRIIGPENERRSDFADLLIRSLSDNDANVRAVARLGLIKIGAGTYLFGPLGIP